MHVVASIFERKMYIPSNKKYLLMRGDRIRKTIIIEFRSNKTDSPLSIH